MHRRRYDPVMRGWVAVLCLVAILAGCAKAAQPTPTVVRSTPAAKGTTAQPTATPLALRATATLSVEGTISPVQTPRAENPDEGIALTILHTNDVYGYTEPCG